VARWAADDADGRRNCNGNITPPILRILNGEMTRIDCNCEKLCDNLSGTGRGGLPARPFLGFAVAVPKLLQLTYPCQFAVQDPWNP